MHINMKEYKRREDLNFIDVRDFQSSRDEIVSQIGALLISLKTFRDLLVQENDYDFDLIEVRELQVIVAAFDKRLVLFHDFYEKSHYRAYNIVLNRTIMNIINLLGRQTLPSERLSNPDFYRELFGSIKIITEIMIATAQIIVYPINANIKSNNPFSAFLFFESLMSSITSSIILVDPYIDASIFSRYLAKLNNTVNIKIITDEGNLKGSQLIDFVDIEKLFLAQHPSYIREMRNLLHDRYLITETHAYSLGGSIKDAAKKSDYIVTELSPQQRLDLLKIYA